MKPKYIKYYKNKEKVKWHSIYWKYSHFYYIKLSNGCIILDF